MPSAAAPPFLVSYDFRRTCADAVIHFFGGAEHCVSDAVYLRTLRMSKLEFNVVVEFHR